MTKLTKAIILCAGYGTRSMPASKAVPKELFPISEKPALMYHIEECYDSGIREVLIVTNEDKLPTIKKFFTHNEKVEEAMKRAGSIHYLDGLNKLIDNMKIDYVVQPVMNGTGGAILLAEEWTKGEPFALLFGDGMFDYYMMESNNGKKIGVPALRFLVEQFKKNADGKTIVGSQEVSKELITSYCSIGTTEKINDRCFKFDRVIEKPKPEEVISYLSGLDRYILQGDIYDYIRRLPAKGPNKEICITDAFDLIARETGDIYCFNMPNKRYDLGNKLQTLIASVEYGLKSSYSESFREYLIDLAKKLEEK